MKGDPQIKFELIATNINFNSKFVNQNEYFTF